MKRWAYPRRPVDRPCPRQSKLVTSKPARSQGRRYVPVQAGVGRVAVNDDQLAPGGPLRRELLQVQRDAPRRLQRRLPVWAGRIQGGPLDTSRILTHETGAISSGP